MAIARREEFRVAEEAKALAAAQVAETAALEVHRLNAHFNVGVERAVAGGDAALAAFLQSSPEEHMKRAPEGVNPADYRTIPTAAPALVDDAVAKTALGQALLAKGVQI